MLKRQAVQARFADAAILMHAWACTMAKLDRDLRAHAGNGDAEFQRDRAAAMHFFDLAEVEIRQRFTELYENADDTMLRAADVALAHNAAIAPSHFIIPERSPTPERGKGRTPGQQGIKQFPGSPRPQHAPEGVPSHL
jgi:hypothetical protein